MDAEVKKEQPYVTTNPKWPGEPEVWAAGTRLFRMSSGSEAMHSIAQRFVSSYIACTGMEDPEEEVSTAKAQAERMEWTVLDNAKQRMKVADLEAEIAALRAQLAEAERERTHDAEAIDGAARLIVAQGVQLTATKAALDEAVKHLSALMDWMDDYFGGPDIDEDEDERASARAFLAAHAAKAEEGGRG